MFQNLSLSKYLSKITLPEGVGAVFLELERNGAASKRNESLFYQT